MATISPIAVRTSDDDKQNQTKPVRIVMNHIISILFWKIACSINLAILARLQQIHK